jgi:uncharacterized delta-60 repeat protein
MTTGFSHGNVPFVSSYMAKEIMKKFTSLGLQNFTGRFSFLTLVLLVLLGLMVNTGEAQFSFAGAQVLPGDYWGSVTNDNTVAVPDLGAPSTAGFPSHAPLWYSWTAPASGEVLVDCQGSVFITTTQQVLVSFPPPIFATNVVTTLQKLDTVLGVYGSGTNVALLNQVAANDDLYPISQQNITGQNIYSNAPSFFDIAPATNPPTVRLIRSSYQQPYTGPSGLRFNARAGTTYYFTVDTKFLTGPLVLNWALHSSGIFRLASENIDQTGLKDTNGIPLLLYQTAETESSRWRQGTVNAAFLNTTYHTYYQYDVPGVLVTVTRVAGSSGREIVDYTTMDGTTNLINNGDGLAISFLDYIPVSGQLVFDDFEMSKTIFIPIFDDFGFPEPNRDFIVQLTNAAPDLSESALVSPPRLDPAYSQAVVRILDTDIDPKGVGQYTITNAPSTNGIPAYSSLSTNGIFNFQKSNYRVSRDVSEYWGNTLITVYVNRSGTNRESETVHWSVDAPFVSDVNVLANALFPLQPGSDYAVPTPAISGGVLGANSDFDFPGGYSGTINFPGGNNVNPQPIQFSVANYLLPAFNKDLTVQIYQTDSNGNPIQPGMVAQTTVTILFDDENPPAGSVDEFYNADYNLDLALSPTNVPVTNPPQNPNPGADGPVNAMLVDASNKTIIGGEFFSYNGTDMGCIARLNTDGSLDTSFNPGSGVDATIEEFIAGIALSPDGKFFVGGDFSSFDGIQRNGIARLNSDGSLDTTFNPGLGANGTVWAVSAQSDGKVIIGGDFTQVNSITRKYIARLNQDGSVDTSFDLGNTFNGPIYTLAMPAGSSSSTLIYLGGQFQLTVNGQTNYNIARINTTNGVVDTTFNPGKGPYDGPVFTLAVQPDNKVLLGGAFNHVNGTTLNRLARLNADGSIDQTNFFSGTGADDTVYNLSLDADGTFYVGGQFSSINGTHRLGFARLYADGTVDTTFLDTAYNQFAGLPKIYFKDPPGIVFASAIQSDGNVMIGGSFSEVGGGQFNPEVRQNNLQGYDYNVWPEPKQRDGVRNRNNVARLIGGSSAGPGNVSLLYNNYSANKSDQYLYVSLLRTNGTLGSVSANFTVQSSLTAQSGSDFIYNSPAPFYGVAWEYVGIQTRMHSDGLYGTNTFLKDIYGNIWWNYQVTLLSRVIVTMQNNTSNPGNLNTDFQLANPSTADQFYLGGQNVPLAGALGRSSSPFTLVDNNQKPGTFGFASDSFVTTNAASLSAAIGVVRTNGAFGTVSLKYSATNGTALAGTDYTGITNVTMTFLGNVVSNSFNVILKNAGLSYSNTVERTVNLGLSGPLATGASFGLSNAVLRMLNPNFKGYLSFTTTDYSNTLSAGFIQFTAKRVAGTKGTLSVMYATTNGTAISGVDYTGVTNQLIWNDGDAVSKIVAIPLVPSSAVGANKQFGVRLFNPTNGVTSDSELLAAGVISNATLTIINDNSYGKLQFSAPSYLVNETGGYTTINVVRSGSTNGSVSVNYATSDGPALNPANYVATNGVLTFAPGQVVSSFNVQIRDDGVFDPTPPANFYFNVTLSNPTNAVLGSPTNAPVQIVDAATYTYPPGGPDTSFDPATGMNADVVALALQSNGQIVAGGNFTAVGSTPENYIARLNTDGSLDTTFLDGLSGANGAVRALINQNNDRIVIGGAFTLVNGIHRNYICRLLTDGSLDTSFNPGSGADSTVYALAEGFVGGARKIYVGGAFGAINGVTRPSIARLNDNGTVDTSFATGLGANAPVYALAAYPTNSPYAGKVLVGGAFTNLNGLPLNYIARLNVDGSVDTNFNLNMGTSDAVHAITIQVDGKVLIGGNFTNVNGMAANRIARLNVDGSLDTNFVANSGAGANQTVLGIAVQADNRIVYVGQFTSANGVTRNGITRLLPTGAVDPTINFGAGANGAVESLVIQPTDGMLVIGGAFTSFNSQPHERIARLYGGSVTGSGEFTFTSSDYSVNENGVVAAITIARTGGTSGTNSDGSGNVSVTFTTSDGTATNGVNYNAVVANVIFPPGEVLESVAVPVIDDLKITTNLTVNLDLSNPTLGTSIGVQNIAVLTIYNTDNAISFSSSYYSRTKNAVDGVATIDIIRQGSAVGTATVNFTTTTNGTAIPGVDYYPTNYLVTFNPGVSDVSVKVPIINNGIPEGNTTIGMDLTNVVGSVPYAPTNAVLTIIDTVTAPGTLAFAATNYVYGEGDGLAYLTVLRTNGSSGSVSVSYQTVPGTAQPAVNYTTTSGILTFGDGETSKVITVPLTENNLVQGEVSLSVVLSFPTGGAALGVVTNSTLTILDDDVGVAFSAATNSFIETAGIATVYASRIGGTNGSFSVNYATTNGSALYGTNYTAVSGTLNFTGGQTVQAISIPLTYDPRVTGDLNFSVKLSSPTSGAQIVVPTNTVVVVTDADAGISFTNAVMSVLKTAGNAVITVVCSNPSVEPVTASNTVLLSVNYSTVNGTATAGVHYTAVSGTLVFTNGNATNTFTVPILYNGSVDIDRTFTVKLSNVTAPGKLVAPSNQVVTIVEGNNGFSFSSPTYTVLRSGIAATISVLRTGNTDSVASVNFSATNGTAVNGVDFYATNGLFVFTNGQVSKTFAVTVIPNSAVQPDKSVLLQLFNATNALLVAPNAATLTIHDTSGSLVVPAGSAFAPGGDPNGNGIIDPGETVSLYFGLRVSGGVNVTNVGATLLVTNGVTAPSSPQNYGTLVFDGPSTSRIFSFTASGTNAQVIAPTFQITGNPNGTNNLGISVFTYTLGTWTNIYANTNVIIVNDYAMASPYPSMIDVSGVGGTLVKATVCLTNVTHGSPKDIIVLLVAPNQHDTLIMGHAGGQNALNHLTLKFDDAAVNSLPPSEFPQTSITNGTYKPTGYLPVPKFP